MNTSICFLQINSSKDLTKYSIQSCLKNTRCEIYLGYINPEDILDFKSEPRIHFLDLSKEAAALGIIRSEYQDFSKLEFFSLVQLKWELILKIFKNNNSDIVQYCDLDIIWLRDPTFEIAETFKINHQAQILVQDFSTNPSLPNLCMGFAAFRNSKECVNIITELKHNHRNMLRQNSYIGDDDVITARYRYTPSTQIQLLPQVSFPVGNMGLLYSNKVFYPGIEVPSPFIFHANFVVGIRQKIEYLDLVAKRFNVPVEGLSKFSSFTYSMTRWLRIIKYKLN